jgi:serine phosphatase RsbU (regulator of sigma subunit)
MADFPSGDATPLTALVGQLLPTLDAAFPTDLVDVLADFLHEHGGATDVELLLADYDLDLLVCVRRDEPAMSVRELPVEGSDAGRAYTTQTAVTVPGDDGTIVLLPVSLRSERLGVLHVRLPQGEVPATTLEALHQVTTVIGYVIFAAGRYTDMYEQARRRKPLALDAEMQWNLLPVRAFSGPLFEIAGQLMPAYDVGGDCFDYSVESDALYVSVTDAMGHGIEASLLDSLTVSALRNARRAGAGIADQVAQAHHAVHQQFNSPPPGGPLRPVQFVTALVARIDLAGGQVTIINAGHPPPYLLRDGELSLVPLSPQPPLGLSLRTTYLDQRFELRAGDRVFDAGPEGAPAFGEARLEDVLRSTAGEAPHEAVRQVLHTVSEYQQSNFRDDATALCLDWRRG